MEELSSRTDGSYGRSPDTKETSPLQLHRNKKQGLRTIVVFLSALAVIVSILLATQIYNGVKVNPHGSVVTDHYNCSIIGANILKIGGNAVDAAVGSTICMGVVRPDVTGLGGGGLMLIYDQRLQKLIQCYNFMPSKSVHDSVGVPGFIDGLKLAHVEYGRLSWSQIMQPSIDLAESGFRMSEKLFEESFNHINLKAANNHDLKEWVASINYTVNQVSYSLADVLKTIARGNSMNFDNKLLIPIHSNYQVEKGQCLSTSMDGFSIYTSGEGTGGPLFIESLKFLSINRSDSALNSVITSFKDFVELNSDYAAGSQISVTDDNDLYAITVSGIGTVLGSQVFVDGYILNNALDISSGVEEGKKVKSSFLPAVVVDDDNICGRRFVLGGTDYKDVIQLLYRLLFNKEDLQSSVEAPRARIHNNEVAIEENHAPPFDASDLASIIRKGMRKISAKKPYPSLNVINKFDDFVLAYADSRGQGKAITF